MISCVPLLQLWLRRRPAMDHRLAPRVQHPVPAPAWPAGLSRKQVKLLSARVTDWSRAASCVLTGLTRAAPDEAKFARATYLKDLTSTARVCTCNYLLQHAVVSAVLTPAIAERIFHIAYGILTICRGKHCKVNSAEHIVVNEMMARAISIARPLVLKTRSVQVVSIAEAAAQDPSGRICRFTT